MTTGQRIKKFRLAQNLSQKALADRAGMSEPAIRNYELGNRMPYPSQLEKVAYALHISELALSEPQLDTDEGVMHALFYLEDAYGIAPVKVNGRVTLSFPIFSSLSCQLRLWHDELDALAKGHITQEEYENWQNNYPSKAIPRKIT